MSGKPYDLLVFIGRFQPFHNGHLAVVQHGLAKADHLLILAGSACRPRSVRDPFTADERAEMIVACLDACDARRVTVAPLADAMYNDPVWIRNVHRAVFACMREHFPECEEAELRIGLVGHGKDNSSYYLKLFPTWGAVDVANHEGISATDLRGMYFRQAFESGMAAPEVDAAMSRRMPAAAYRRLKHFAATPAYAELRAEQGFIDHYQAQFDGLKYLPQHHTADAVVIQSGHILLVRRRGRPGKGLLALPGGFVQPDETSMDGAVRELREETQLDIAEDELRGALSARDLFDDPHRSARGRTFTTAFRFDLRQKTHLPAVRAGDDADRAFWLPLAKLRSEEMFEDHYHIVQKMVGV
jgi:bifunctional NMN adenylyltransferase/nudix hydrolase